MSTQESINRKKFLMTLGFSGSALMAVLSSCLNEKQTVPGPISVTPSVPNAPSVSASTVTGSPITVTTESAGTVLVFNGITQIGTFTAVVGANTFTPSSAGVYTFKLKTANGTSGASAPVTVTDLAITKDLLTLDLTLSANSALLKVGGYIRQSNIVVALVAANTYAAVTQICSHEGQKQVIYQSGEFYCQSHGARFTTSGVGLNGNGKGGLTVYKTSLIGNILHITA